jgi:pyruvate dehydrogenase E1 component
MIEQHNMWTETHQTVKLGVPCGRVFHMLLRMGQFLPRPIGDTNSQKYASSLDDRLETAEWIEAFDQVLKSAGTSRGEELLRELNLHGLRRGVNIARTLNTPYVNTVQVREQPRYPGDLGIEGRIGEIIRWNAMAMVVRANLETSELGGHLASYASAADLFEVGFHHFFRGPGTSRETQSATGGDLVFFQPHSSPGIYARAFLEGRLTEDQLRHYRREVGGRGLPSYPHPWLMRDFWQFPTGSMGLGVVTAIYQARFMRYLQARNISKTTSRKVWVFVGDGEMDEPESIAGLTLAARENLDNIIFVVNCNLQRLDGPVRGNGSIIQELESLFAGAGWSVLKVLWGSEWDALFALDESNSLERMLRSRVDGEMQSLGAGDAVFNREHFFNHDPGVRGIAEHFSDEQINKLRRGGHDPIKIYAAFDRASKTVGRPTVILALTKKGFGLGHTAESRMAAHQHKKLSASELLWLRDQWSIPLSDEQAKGAAFYRPAGHSPELDYLRARRLSLGGYFPSRNASVEKICLPRALEFAEFAFVQDSREMSTTVAFVRMLTKLLKATPFGERIVPIVADEARTFGLQSLFRQVGIYSHCGQKYVPEDHSDFLHYLESSRGQILEEGISEVGALSSWIAAATSYAHHGVPMLPFYIFYSMFGFQRVGDLIWAAADSRSRGFLLGATAGRTTLAGEGLQHQDGTSHLIASTIPNCRAYDPCFAYELAAILEEGLAAMLERQEDAFYYVTVMNEAYSHPAMPAGAQEGIVCGMYRIRNCALEARAKVQLLGSGTILREALAAAELLEQEWGIAADVWSVTSYSQLRWDALAIDRQKRLDPNYAGPSSWLERCLGMSTAPLIAATDYVGAVPDLIRPWIKNTYITLGTDGFGRSDTRQALRQFFEVDRKSITLAAIRALVHEGTGDPSLAKKCLAQYGISSASPAPWLL